jgi:hypothetical protein
MKVQQRLRDIGARVAEMPPMGQFLADASPVEAVV